MERIRNNERMSRIAIILFWVMIASYVASIISSYMQYDLIQSIWNGEGITQEALENNDSREIATGVISFISFLCAATGFYMWLKTAYHNLSIKKLNLVNKEVWDKGIHWYGYLYVPYKVIKELFVETQSLLSGKGLISQEQLSTKLFGAWWTFFLFSQFLGRVISRVARNVDSLTSLYNLTIAHLTFETVAIAFGLLSIKIISDYSAVEPLISRLPDAKLDFIVDPVEA